MRRFGDLNWSVRRNDYPTLLKGSYGFYVYFDRGSVSLAEVRRAVEELSAAHSVILCER